MNSLDVTAGHLGHLTAPQQAAFDALKRSVAALPRASQLGPDEPTLLRFLRARRFDAPKAFKQLADSEAWRAKHDVDSLFASFPAEELETTRKYYPRWTGRRDKNGLPIYVYRIASLTPPIQKELNAVPPERRYQRIIALYEGLTRLTMRLCSHLPHATAPTPISSVTTIIDLDGVTLPLLWSLRAHLQEASTLATANYPETLSTIAVVNAPSFFPTAWGWIKPWFDEGTRNKVHVLGRDPGPTLREFIDPKELPRTYGGELDWKFEDEPALDEPARTALGGAWPRGPHVFVNGELRKPTPDGQDLPPLSTPSSNGAAASPAPTPSPAPTA